VRPIEIGCIFDVFMGLALIAPVATATPDLVVALMKSMDT
jgi:hypothetical protein